MTPTPEQRAELHAATERYRKHLAVLGGDSLSYHESPYFNSRNMERMTWGWIHDRDQYLLAAAYVAASAARDREAGGVVPAPVRSAAERVSKIVAAVDYYKGDGLLAELAGTLARFVAGLPLADGDKGRE